MNIISDPRVPKVYLKKLTQEEINHHTKTTPKCNNETTSPMFADLSKSEITLDNEEEINNIIDKVSDNNDLVDLLVKEDIPDLDIWNDYDLAEPPDIDGNLRKELVLLWCAFTQQCFFNISR